MGKYFTDEQIDVFLMAYLERYPDAIERMHFVMKHPFRDNDLLISRSWDEIVEIAMSMDFFHEYARNLHEEYMRRQSGPYYHSYSHIIHDVARRVADMLGPIGSYEIEE